MKKHKTLIFFLVVLAMTFYSSGLGCGRPFGMATLLNREVAKSIPVLRKDAQLIIDKLEFLRLGLSAEKDYGIYFDNRDGNGYQIKILSRDYYGGNRTYNFTERPEEFSAEQIDAINYLFLSDELQLNAFHIFYYRQRLRADFAIDDDHWWYLSIMYFDPDDANDVRGLEYYRRNLDHVEAIGRNYWMVMWFQNRG